MDGPGRRADHSDYRCTVRRGSSRILTDGISCAPDMGSFVVSESVIVRVTNNNFGPSAVVGGIFFDPYITHAPDHPVSSRQSGFTDELGSADFEYRLEMKADMKKLYRLVAFLLLASWACLAQGPPTNMPNTVIATFPGAPSGTCSPTMIATRTDTGAFYDSFGNVWTTVSSGAGTVTSVTRHREPNLASHQHHCAGYIADVCDHFAGYSGTCFGDLWSAGGIQHKRAACDFSCLYRRKRTGWG